MGKKDKKRKRRRELPPIREDFFDRFNKTRRQHNATWEEVFERFYNYEDWVEHLFNLPKKPSEIDKINAVTVTYLLPTWLEHIYDNFIKENTTNIKPLEELKNTNKPGTPGLVIAAGPSLHNDNNLELLRDSSFYRDKKGVIISTAHTLKDCIDAGVIPNYVVLIDESDIQVDFIDIDDKYAENITGIFIPTVHRDVLKRWKGKSYFYIGVIPERTIPNVQAVLTTLFPCFTVFDGGSNCGTVSWNIARYIGCTQIALLGLDFAFNVKTPVQETPYYTAFRPSYKSEEEMLKKAYRFHTHSFFGTNCYTDSMFDGFMKTAVSLFKEANKTEGIETINCSQGIIDDPEVKNMWFKDWLEGFENDR